ncbi:MAG: hypothetical protein ABI680_13045 [Chthoniobacteraceae bacterium]
MKKSTDTTLAINADYRQFVEELKARVTTARLSTARRLNHEMIFLYWDSVGSWRNRRRWGGANRWWKWSPRNYGRRFLQ